MHWSVAACIGLAVVGLGIGILSGMLGIGGGVLVIPALTILFGMTHSMAIGTSLGMLLPPIGIAAFFRYYKVGQVDPAASLLLALGFAFGAYLGAVLVTRKIIPDETLRRIFAFFLLYLAGNLLFRSNGRVAAVLFSLLKTAALMLAFAGSFFLFRWLGKRWEKSLSIGEIYRERLERPLPPDYEI
jgi:uncharacterized membrane protein YfcA